VSVPWACTLFEMRRDGAGPLLTRRLILSLSNDAKSNLNVVGLLKVPTFVELTVKYDQVIKDQRDGT